MKRSRRPEKHHSPPIPNLELTEVIGITTKNGNGLASGVSSSKCAYVAGCVVVLYDVESSTKSHLMVPNRVPKPLTCVALSRDGSVVAAGESGHQPAILVWDCKTIALICDLKGHQYGVTCVALLSAGKHLASVGFPRDGYLCLWDWQNKMLLRKIKASSISSPIVSIECSSDEKFIVTAGKNQLKFWKVNSSSGSRVSTRSVSVTLQRKVDIAHLKTWSFVGVTSPSQISGRSVSDSQAVERSPFYAVTERGSLYVVYPGSLTITSVDLEVKKCFALSASNNLVACACNNGVVKLFRSRSLKYAGKLCYGRCHDSPNDPHAVACQFSNVEKLMVVYDDHSLYIWNLQDISKATRCCVVVSHSGCIWDIKNVPCPKMHDQPLSCVAEGSSGGLSFATCSADGTIRLWDLVRSADSPSSLSLADDGSFPGTTCLVTAGIFELDSVTNYTSSPGFRSMAVSSDGKHLAAGDFQGNIHVFNLFTSEYKCIADARGTEILSLCFNLTDVSDIADNEAAECPPFLASGGKDGIIYLFDVQRNFDLFGRIDYHSSAVTVVTVARSSREILSCDAARSLVLHRVGLSGEECEISCLSRMANKGAIIDMVFNHLERVAVTVGEDKKITIHDIQCGKLLRSFEPGGEVGNPIKVIIDNSCSYLACCYANGCIRMYDYKTGEMVAQAKRPGDVSTGIIFLPDCEHLISVDVDGCIFVWKLPALISSRMLQKNKEVSRQYIPESKNQPLSSNPTDSWGVASYQHKDYSKEYSANKNQNQRHEETFFRDGSPETSGFRFSISRLPRWAQCKVIADSLPVDVNSSTSEVESVQDNAFPESQIASKDIPQVGKQSAGYLSRNLSEKDSSQGSHSPPRSCREFANRWLTIYTVCMDPLDSPTTCKKKPATCSKRMVEDQIMETNHYIKRIKLSSLGQSAEPDLGDNEPVDLQNASIQDYKDFNTSWRSQPGKLDDFLAQAARNASPSSLMQNTDITEHNCADVPKNTTGAQIPLDMELVNITEQEARHVNKVGKVEIVQSCEEALHRLEAAAETTFLSFFKLATNVKDKSTGCEAQLYAKAATKLQAIERKIHSIAKLLPPVSYPQRDNLGESFK